MMARPTTTKDLPMSTLEGWQPRFAEASISIIQSYPSNQWSTPNSVYAGRDEPGADEQQNKGTLIQYHGCGEKGTLVSLFSNLNHLRGGLSILRINLSSLT